MDLFDVEGIGVKFMLKDKLLQVIECFFMRRLQKENIFNIISSTQIQSGTGDSMCPVSEVSLWIVEIRIATINAGNVM